MQDRPPRTIDKQASRSVGETRRWDQAEVYRLLVENSLDLVSLLAPDGTILYASPSHEKVLGYRPDDVIGRNALEFVHPEDMQAAREALVQSVKSGFVWLDALRFRHKDGHDVVLEGKGTVLYDEAGMVRGVIASSRDVTERMRLLEREQKAREEAERIADELREANEAKDEFLGVVSHELRTPLTSIYGGIRLLAHRSSEVEDPEMAALVTDMVQDSERLRRLLDDLMALARAELGHELMTEPVLLQRAVDNEVSSLQKQRPGRPVYVNRAKQLPMVSADYGYLGQVIRNLLSNADKYSPPGVPIEVEAVAREHEVVLSVLDRGEGVADEERERIFDRFYRSERTARRTRGIGLGLAVCRRLIELQSGRIWAEPREGGGLKVSFTLPLFEG